MSTLNQPLTSASAISKLLLIALTLLVAGCSNTLFIDGFKKSQSTAEKDDFLSLIYSKQDLVTFLALLSENGYTAETWGETQTERCEEIWAEADIPDLVDACIILEVKAFQGLVSLDLNRINNQVVLATNSKYRQYRTSIAQATFSEIQQRYSNDPEALARAYLTALSSPLTLYYLALLSEMPVSAQKWAI